MSVSPIDQCIVLPFHPVSPADSDGCGLALHFLIGNVLVLHTGFKEMWFGWRAPKIFPRSEGLRRYCRSAGEQLTLEEVSRAQNIRFWIHGRYTKASLALHFFDNQASEVPLPSIDLAVATGDGLVQLRADFIQWLAALRRPMPKRSAAAALWAESIDHHGLDAVGRALEAFYLCSYGGRTPLTLSLFEQTVAVAPESFMAHNLFGWALYRNREYISAKVAFSKSLRINPAGAGAMSGLMWCAVHGKDLEETMYWSARKADVCGHDENAAREKGRQRYEKVNG